MGSPATAMMLGGGLLTAVGGHQQGQAVDRASRDQQRFLEDVYRARLNSPYAQRINQLMGFSPWGGGQQVQQYGHPLSMPPAGVSMAGPQANAGSAPQYGFGSKYAQDAIRNNTTGTGRLNMRDTPVAGTDDVGFWADPVRGSTPAPVTQAATPATDPVFQPTMPGGENPNRSLINAIMGVQEAGAVSGAQAGREQLENVLGRAGATGGALAQPLASASANLPSQLAGIRAGGMQMERQFGREDINDLLNVMNVMYPSAGSAVGPLAQSYGTPGYGGQGLMGMGGALGSVGLMDAMGLFGGGGGYGVFGGQAPGLPLGYGAYGPEQF